MERLANWTYSSCNNSSWNPNKIVHFITSCILSGTVYKMFSMLNSFRFPLLFSNPWMYDNSLTTVTKIQPLFEYKKNSIHVWPPQQPTNNWRFCLDYLSYHSWNIIFKFSRHCWLLHILLTNLITNQDQIRNFIYFGNDVF